MTRKPKSESLARRDIAQSTEPQGSMLTADDIKNNIRSAMSQILKGEAIPYNKEDLSREMDDYVSAKKRK